MILDWVDWDRLWWFMDTFRRSHDGFIPFSTDMRKFIRAELLGYPGFSRQPSSGYHADAFYSFELPFNELPSHINSLSPFIRAVVRYRLEVGR